MTPTAQTRLAVASLLVLVLGVTASGCGGSGNGDLTLTVGSLNSPEQAILGQIYAQALAGAGYEVKVDHSPFAGALHEKLEDEELSGYPEHVNSALESLGVETTNVSGDAQADYKKAKGLLEREVLTAFPPTPFSLGEAVGMLRKTSEKRGLKDLSDLVDQAPKMTMLGPLACHVRLTCLGGLERYYGIGFLAYSNVNPKLRYHVLENGRTDTSILPSTDGRLAAEKDKFVILDDDKHALAAGNVIFVTAPGVVEEAGSDYEGTIVDAQKGLTLPTMQRLVAAVEIEKKDPKQVAAEYLKSIDFEG
jgi:osmoprotectant transport system substrate-binding protein